MTSTSRTVTGVFGIGRALVGTGIVALPDRVAPTLGVDTASAQRTDFLSVLIGGREIALGVGSVAAAVAGGPVRPWLLAFAVTDSADAYVMLRGASQGRFPMVPSVALGALGVTSAAVSVAAALKSPS